MIKILLLSIFALLIVASRAQLIPFVNCTINLGSTCITTWGYQNSYPSTIVLPLFRNQFSPAPVFRNQPTVFSASTTVYKAFNTTRACSTGSLTWSLTDPFTNVVHSATATNATGDTCSPQPPVVINCTNNTLVAQRLTQCQTQCGSQCAYCGQVYSYCDQIGSLTANFTLDNCIITNLGFTPVSSGCNYQQVVDNCCQNVGPPVTPPVAPPVEPPIVIPIAPPVEPPIVIPIAPPVEPPVVVPISPPIVVPVSPPVTPTCTSVPTIACSSNIDCPLYFGCDGVRCTNIQGLSCSQDLTCSSGNCTDAPSCLCSVVGPTSNYCLDSTCGASGCMGFQCYPGGPPFGGCLPSLAPCNTSDDCATPKPFCVNGFCHDYSCLDDACRDIRIPYCDVLQFCPTDTVCDDTQGSYCVGSVGGQCISDGDCNPAFTCQGCTCEYTEPTALQSSVVSTCDDRILVGCGDSFSFAFQQSVTSPYGLDCPNFDLVAGYPVAFFTVQGTGPFTNVNLAFSAQINSVPPQVALYTSCTSNQLGGCDSSTFIDPTASVNYNGSLNRNVVVWYPSQAFANSLGAIVNVTITCT